MLLRELFSIKPFLCPGCDSPTFTLLCNPCSRSLRKNHEMIRDQNSEIPGIFAVYHSFSTTHRILTHWKDHGGVELKKTLFQPSGLLMARLRESEFEAIIPIPQDESRSLKRGHASALEVASFFSLELRLPLLRHTLDLKKSDSPIAKQADLDHWHRAQSANPFTSKPILDPKIMNVLLVDDFVTSGSTIEKAAAALRQNNEFLKIHAACLGWKPRNVRQQ